MTHALGLLRQRGLVPASGNAGKITELLRQLEPLGITVVEPTALGINLHPDESGVTFRENAEIKARAFYEALRRPVLADDSGLCVEALSGLPGVESARFGGPGLDDAGRCALLLEKLSLTPQPWDAQFECVLALMLGPNDLHFFTGAVAGQILGEPRGAAGFGYDPVFLDLVTGRSFAELSPAEKDERSHRGRALRGLMAWLGGGPALPAKASD